MKEARELLAAVDAYLNRDTTDFATLKDIHTRMARAADRLETALEGENHA
ncbi:hypothetical protein ParaKuw1_00028 [Paracoccus phage ParKuw1]|uniref:Uncharacterized protein n=1 Tax=Paracoccus phage ParKuw1 TaxID=3032415 RepID=A0AAF0FJT0_9CAUD|nr:hypothetical protein ParaKuw1_00028 [Paracoccus phage ParKuw1]